MFVRGCGTHSSITPKRVFMERNDYLGKNRTLMKIVPLQFAPRRPAVGVIVYGYYRSSVSVHREVLGQTVLVKTLRYSVCLLIEAFEAEAGLSQ